MKNTLISLACASVGIACSSGPALAGPRVVAPPIAVSLQPNYTSRLEHRLSWPVMPVRVFFVPDKNYSQDRVETAKAGFDHWVRATSGFVRYSVSPTPQKADIFVRFTPDINGGLTRTHFRKGRLFRADMMVGVALDEADDIECTAAHEFGHALGIDGHSDDRADLMYPIHVMGHGFAITERDVNTLAASYQTLAKKLAAQRETRVLTSAPSMGF